MIRRPPAGSQDAQWLIERLKAEMEGTVPGGGAAQNAAAAIRQLMGHQAVPGGSQATIPVMGAGQPQMLPQPTPGQQAPPAQLQAAGPPVGPVSAPMQMPEQTMLALQQAQLFPGIGSSIPGGFGGSMGAGPGFAGGIPGGELPTPAGVEKPKGTWRFNADGSPTMLQAMLESFGTTYGGPGTAGAIREMQGSRRADQAQRQLQQQLEGTLGGSVEGPMDPNAPVNPLEAAVGSTQLKQLEGLRDRLQAAHRQFITNKPVAQGLKQQFEMLDSRIKQLRPKVEAQQFAQTWQPLRQQYEQQGMSERDAGRQAAADAVFMGMNVPEGFQHLLPDKKSLDDYITASALRASTKADGSVDDAKFLENVNRAKASNVMIKTEAEATAREQLRLNQQVPPLVQRILGSNATTAAELQKEGYRLPNLDTKEGIERWDGFMSQHSATERAMEVAGQVQQSLIQNPAAYGPTGTATAWLNSVVATAGNTLGLLGVTYKSDVLDPDNPTYKGLWDRLNMAGTQNRANRARMLDLAFLMAGNENITAKNLNAAMLQRILDRLGMESTNDPEAAAFILEMHKRSMAQRLQDAGEQTFFKKPPSVLPPMRDSGWTPQHIVKMVNLGILRREDATKILREEYPELKR